MRVWVVNKAEIKVRFTDEEFRAIVTEARKLDRPIQQVIADVIQSGLADRQIFYAT